MKRGLAIFSLILLLAISLVSAQTCTDEDGDGYSLEGAANCNNPGFSDCNDNDYIVYPGAPEIVDGLDNDCNGIVDDSLQVCTDSDKDGYNSNNGNAQCAVNGQYDCDDSTATVSPAKTEIAGNNIDDNCNGQVDEQSESPAVVLQPEAECVLSSTSWFDCDANVISTAHEGDSVFLVAESNRCSQDSVVQFQLTELNEETTQSTDVDSMSADFDLDAGASQIFWAGKWTALWEDDGTANQDPEYYFDTTISQSQSTRTSTELKVTKCPTPGCEITCDSPAGFASTGGSGGSGGNSGPFVICNPGWDCSSADWNECDPATNTVSRDISLCTFTGTGDEQCMEQSRAELKSEESCTASTEFVDDSSSQRQSTTKARCGNKKCEAGEDKTCPKDCPKAAGFPWLLLILILVFLLLVGGGVAYYFLTKKKSAATATVATAAEEEKMPFENPNDLNAVINYIKLSKQRNVPDDKAVEMLRKSGWKDEQIKFAWAKIAQKPQPGQQQKPAQQNGK